MEQDQQSYTQKCLKRKANHTEPTLANSSIVYYTSDTKEVHMAHRRKLLVGVAQVMLGL